MKFGSPFFGKANAIAGHIDQTDFLNMFASEFNGEISGEFYYNDIRFYWHITKDKKFGRTWFFITEEERKAIQELEEKVGEVVLLKGVTA